MEGIQVEMKGEMAKSVELIKPSKEIGHHTQNQLANLSSSLAHKSKYFGLVEKTLLNSTD